MILCGWGGYALWFIPVLYISLLICKYIYNDFLHNVLFIFGISLIAIFLCYDKVCLPWTLSTVPIACTYLLLSRMYGKIVIRLLLSKHQLLKLLFILIGLCVTIISSHFYRLDLASNQILPFLPLIITAILGSIMMLCLSDFILKLPIMARIFRYVGQNTIVILALSQCIIRILNEYIATYVVLKYLLLIIILALVTVIIGLLKRCLVYRKC